MVTTDRHAYDLVWRVRTRLAERFGQRCRMLVRSTRMNSCLIEFTDGYQVITSVNYVRRMKATPLFDTLDSSSG